ncbi:MAG: TorF family putative porin [Woeseia sp.]
MNLRTARRLTPLILLFSLNAAAELSANVGWVSDYYYRGIAQHASSASAGIDFDKDGFYVGSWAADVGDGLEVDTYFGWGGEIGDVSIGGGFTGYYYTGDFDDTYQELNFSLGYGIASAEVAVGEYDNFAGPTQDYTYYALTLEKEGFYGKYAGFSQDFAGNYLELGYGASLETLDLSIALILSDKDLVGNKDEALVFGISKSFQLD